LELPSIERSSLLEVARKDSPNEEVILKSPPDGILNATPAVKCNLEEMLVMAEEDKTPLRMTDLIQSESQEKRKGRQLEQAQKMMKIQGVT
jgi:hypothetical protein